LPPSSGGPVSWSDKAKILTNRTHIFIADRAWQGHHYRPSEYDAFSRVFNRLDRTFETPAGRLKSLEADRANGQKIRLAGMPSGRIRAAESPHKPATGAAFRRV